MHFALWRFKMKRKYVAVYLRTVSFKIRTKIDTKKKYLFVKRDSITFNKKLSDQGKVKRENRTFQIFQKIFSAYEFNRILFSCLKLIRNVTTTLYHYFSFDFSLVNNSTRLKMYWNFIFTLRKLLKQNKWLTCVLENNSNIKQEYYESVDLPIHHHQSE